MIEVEVVGAYGAGADEAHRATLQQGGIHPGHRAHQQHIGFGQGISADARPG